MCSEHVSFSWIAFSDWTHIQSTLDILISRTLTSQSTLLNKSLGLPNFLFIFISAPFNSNN